MMITREVGRRAVSPFWTDWATAWMRLWLPSSPSSNERREDEERRMRCEEFVEKGRYGLRTELPGIDPERDLEVTVHDGVLTVAAQHHREESSEHASRSWFGTVTRSITLPDGVDSEAITAVYRDGVLEVSTPLESDDDLVAWFDEVHPEDVAVPVQRAA